MKLKVLDQIHVSSVSSDTLAPGSEIEVSAALGGELMKRHPTKFAQLADSKKAKGQKNKAAPTPENKGAPGAEDQG